MDVENNMDFSGLQPKLLDSEPVRVVVLEGGIYIRACENTIIFEEPIVHA